MPTRSRPGLSRDAAEALLYSGQSAVRFTQDTPFLPDVWIRYAQQPGTALDLLITPFQSPGENYTTPGQLAKELRDVLRSDHPEMREGAVRRRRQAEQVVYNQTTVLASLPFETAVQLLLPFSQWWINREKELDARSALVRLPTGDEEAHATLVRALKRLDEFEREDSRSNMNRFVQARLPQAFGLAEPGSSGESGGGAAPVEGVRTAEALDEAQKRYREFESAFRADLPAAPTGLPPDVLWMLRVVGTLASLPALTARELEGWESLLLRLQALRAEGSPIEPATLQALDRYYDTVVAAAGALMRGLAECPRNGPRLHSVSCCRTARMVVVRSREAVKADAATQVFGLRCRDLAWAVVDSGIDASHPAFLSRETARSRVKATYDFTIFRELLGPPRDIRNPELRDRCTRNPRYAKDVRAALTSGRPLDWEMLLPLIQVPHDASYVAPVHEHGTHVAGIIGADYPDAAPGGSATQEYRGLCPDITLYDFRVLNTRGEGDEFNVMAALQFIRYLNSQRDLPVIHGVNLSLSIPHDVANYACGRTPICEECERLVGAGVVVVAAAGNKGYLKQPTGSGLEHLYHSISITDPGNADGVLTVGATHRFQPHTYGVSYFSSRGPTGDGRLKPDLVAPGEKITSAVPGGAYKPMDGTSMAAPHVSGAAALLMARHRELLGQPARVKEILCRTATDLGRERYFQGWGMVDILRALQSV